MAEGNGTCATECQYVTVGEAKNLIIINYVLATLAATTCLFSIVLMLVLRAYQRYMHRLTLYLAILQRLICSIIYPASGTSGHREI